LERHQVVNKGPQRRALPGGDLAPEGHHSRVGGVGLAESVDEVEPGGGEGEDHGLLCVPSGQSIGHDVGAIGLIFH